MQQCERGDLEELQKEITESGNVRSCPAFRGIPLRIKLIADAHWETRSSPRSHRHRYLRTARIEPGAV